MLIVIGSRRKGNCYYLAERIRVELEKERIHVSTICPGNQKIHICTGCMDCDKDGVCDFTDDMKKNIEKIKKENVVMFITPTRWNLISGDLKLFIDRLNPLYSRNCLKGKKMIAVSIGSKPRSLYSTESSLNSLISFAESAGMEVILDKQFYNCLKSNDISNQEQEISNLVNDIKTKLKNC